MAIDLNKAEGTAEMEQYEQMCQAQVITSPRRKPDNGSFSSTTKLLNSTSYGANGGMSGGHSRKFNSMLQGCEDQDLRITQNMIGKSAISPPSNSHMAETSPIKR